MIPGSLFFVAGVIWLQWKVVLPAVTWCGMIPLLLLCLPFLPRLRLPLLFALGFLWALLHAHWILSTGLAPELEGRDLLVEGVIVSLPERQGRRVRFEFEVERLQAAGAGQYLSPGRVRLSWYETAPALRVGDRWSLKVRMKQPHGFMNPGGFDYEGWLFRQGIRATGYVRGTDENRRLGEGGIRYAIQRWRQALRIQIVRVAGDPSAAALLTALVIGDRSGIERSQWELFTRTGINHLIAISGLHIGIVAGLSFLLIRLIWSRFGWLLLRIPAPQAAAFGALLAAAFYAAMAGFALPTQRALVMLLALLGSLLLRRSSSPGHGLSLALLAVVILDPFSVLSIGFWLSFAAVAAILYSISGRLGKKGFLWQWGRVQWVISLALIPVLVAWGLKVSLVAPLVNLIAVPLFSFLLLPLVLAGAVLLTLSDSLGGMLLQATGWMLGQGIDGLTWVAGLPVVSWGPGERPPWSWLAAMVGGVLLLAPCGLPGRWLGMVFFLPLVTLRPPGPPHGDVWFTLLDVGQGMSVVLRTRNHTLVYDTGPRFSARFDAGSAVLVPYLRTFGIDYVDRVILSNGDQDHQGGLGGLLQRIAVGAISSGEPGRITERQSTLCQDGEKWSWDGVQFRILHPVKSSGWRGNDASCVLQVEAGGRRILIPGDIGARAESALLLAHGAVIKSDLLVVPHHGSATSSSPAFVRVVSPDYALASTGYRNSYGFPRTEVLMRWQDVGSKILNTAETGALTFRLDADGSIAPPEIYRRDTGRYWTHWLKTGDG